MKEHLRAQLASFFISVTLINLAMLILGCLLEPDLEFGYSAFAYPLIYGVIGSLPGLVMYSKKELTMKQTIIREIIQMLLIVVLIIAFMFGKGTNNPRHCQTIGQKSKREANPSGCLPHDMA